MQEEPWRDFVHTGPGLLAGRYLRKSWQPVSRVQDLMAGQALPVHVMGEAFTLFRGETGAPYMIDFRCAHRGAQLSVGWIAGDSIRCRYHGWRYDGSGQCIEQPGEDPSFAAKVQIRSYPCQEYLELVFAYLGDGEAPPMRRYSEFERPGILEAGMPQIWPCNYFNRVENDPSHVPYTHRESARRRGAVSQLAPRVTQSHETSFGVRSVVHTPNDPPQTIDFHMPNINQVRSGVVDSPQVTLKDPRRVPGRNSLFWRVPIDDERHITYVVDFLPLVGEAAKTYREFQGQVHSDELDEGDDWKFCEAILSGKMQLEDLDLDLSPAKMFWMEDYLTQTGQGPIPDRFAEHLGRVDESVVLKRMIWQRELRALAENRPLKEWVESEKLLAGLSSSGTPR